MPDKEAGGDVGDVGVKSTFGAGVVLCRIKLTRMMRLLKPWLWRGRIIKGIVLSAAQVIT